MRLQIIMEFLSHPRRTSLGAVQPCGPCGMRARASSEFEGVICVQFLFMAISFFASANSGRLEFDPEQFFKSWDEYSDAFCG